jgi:hypothetical protein
LCYEQERTPRIKIEYVETKKDTEEPEAEFEGMESSESDSDVEEGKDLEETGVVCKCSCIE